MRMSPTRLVVRGGFSLLELMMAVVILGVLLCIALPSYQGPLARTWRTKAASCLLALSQGMERRYMATLSYVVAGDTDALPAESCVTEDGMQARYAFSFVAAPTAATFSLQAEPSGAQAAQDPECGTLSINALGERSASGAGGVQHCW